MSRKHSLNFFAAKIPLACAASMLLSAGFFAGCSAGNHGVYKSDQTESSHAGYRRSTLTSGSDVYVSDYEEAALQLINPEPSQVIGVSFGGAKICAIPGQSTNAYIAADVGSEMPAYAVFRNTNQPPFDWRTATFREMTARQQTQFGPVVTTTNAALIVEVIRVLRDGTPVELNPFPFSGATNLMTINLTSDQLPGLLFCPSLCYVNGTNYVAESLILQFTVTPPQIRAQWIPASAMLAEWLTAP